MASKVQHVVADAGAFIRNAPLREIGETIYTIPDVVGESCDKATRQRFRTLTFDLKFKEPSSDALQKVTEFAKKTGDYGFLSLVDLRVLALTYDLEKQHNGVDHLKTEPSKRPEFTVGSGQPLHGNDQNSFQNAENIKRYKEGQVVPSTAIEGDEPESDEEDEGISETLNELDLTNDEEKKGVEKEDEEEESEEEEDESDDEGWITPSNIVDVKRSYGVETVQTEDKMSVGCLTTDFAMQNVLIQMGLRVLSVDGMLIKQVKSYVLRCYGCFRITKNTTLRFCPHCGNNTLKRLTTSIDEKGSMRFHLARNYTIHKKKKFSLPRPQGGKHALNPVLTADQPAPHQRPSKKALNSVDILGADFVQDSNPFRLNDVTSRAAQLGRHHRQQMHNPNNNRRKKRK